VCGADYEAQRILPYGHIPDPPNYCIKDSTVGIEEINEATYDEEEEGEMEIDGFIACSPDNIRPQFSLGK
jgi:hypothetical protein